VIGARHHRATRGELASCTDARIVGGHHHLCPAAGGRALRHRTTIGSPPMSASALPGKRDDASPGRDEHEKAQRIPLRRCAPAGPTEGSAFARRGRAALIAGRGVEHARSLSASRDAVADRKRQTVGRADQLAGQLPFVTLELERALQTGQTSQGGRRWSMVMNRP